MGFIYWDGVLVLTLYKAGFLIYIICIPSKQTNKKCWNVAMNPTYFTKSKSKHATSVITKKILQYPITQLIILVLHRMNGKDIKQVCLCLSAKLKISVQGIRLDDYVKNIPNFAQFYNVYTMLSMCTRISMSPLLK